MIYDILYDNLRKRLDSLTPLPFDCGRLCDGACCKGDEDSGMYLFPFEERFYVGKDNFKISKSDLLLECGDRVFHISCKGPCQRCERPISCMIFPFIPYYKKGSPVKVILDPRAKGVCPLLYPETKGYIQDSFYKEVLLFAKYLIKTPKGADFLESISFVLDDYLKFHF